MLNKTIRLLWNNPEIHPVPDTTHHVWDDADHDMIARYAVVGIFTMMAVAALWHAKVIAMPLVAGSLLGVVLGPLVDRLMRFGIPQTVAAALLLLGVVSVALAIMALIAAPIALWADQLPGMAQLLRKKLAVFLSYLQQVEGLVSAINPGGAPKVSVAGGSIVAEVAAGSSTIASGLLLFFATVFAYLATRRHLKARVLRLCLGRAARQSAGNFFEEIERRMAAYFGTLTLVNIGMGLVASVIAWAFGIPFAVVWGVVAFVLNYVPIIGPVMVTGLLFAAGLLDDAPAWTAVAPAAVYFCAHLIEANVVTPTAVGRRLTLSPFMVLVSFVFWLWLWGPVGAILSTPILLFGALAVEVLGSYREAVAEEKASVEDALASSSGAPVEGSILRTA
jgi:predicted PurR-regulated permease PerM